MYWGVDMMNNIDLNLLTVFLEVYRFRSITQAAESLDMTQPGVSGALKRLQNKLGTELFVREGRGISPTHNGVQLANELEPALQCVKNSLGNITGFDINSPRTFVVLVNEAMMQILQPKIENDNSMGKVKIEFRLTPNNEEELIDLLSMQKAELAIDIATPANFSYNKKDFYIDDIVAICRQSHPDIKDTLNQTQYFAQNHITLKMRRAEQYAADYFTIEALTPRNVSCECDSLLSMMALVSTTNCIGIVTRSMADAFASHFSLQTLALPFEAKPIVHKMLWHKRNTKHPAHTWLRDKLMSL